jgi:hypothetical protein
MAKASTQNQAKVKTKKRERKMQKVSPGQRYLPANESFLCIHSLRSIEQG